MSWCLNATTLLGSVCWAFAPYKLLDQNVVNITQCYSQMNGTYRAFNLVFWSLYIFSWIAVKHFWLWRLYLRFHFDDFTWVFSLMDISLLWCSVIATGSYSLCLRWVDQDFFVFNSLVTPTPGAPNPNFDKHLRALPSGFWNEAMVMSVHYKITLTAIGYNNHFIKYALVQYIFRRVWVTGNIDW